MLNSAMIALTRGQWTAAIAQIRKMLKECYNILTSNVSTTGKNHTNAFWGRLAPPPYITHNDTVKVPVH